MKFKISLGSPTPQSTTPPSVPQEPIAQPQTDASTNSYSSEIVTSEQVVPSGPNTTPVKTIKQVDTSKGPGKWLSKMIGASGVVSRMQEDNQQESAYATAHGWQYEAYTQQLPTGPDNIGSALLSFDGATLFYHHMSGLLQGRLFDSVIWFHQHLKKNAEGISTGILTEYEERDTILAGRINIARSVPSLIIASKISGLAVADPQMFTRFQNSNKVTLEGDFNTYFDIYAPKGDPVSAFQSLPPNLMTLLIDKFQGACIEFSGNSIYILILTNSTKKSLGNNQPVFNPAENDALIAELPTLAAFFDISSPAEQQPIDPNDVITDQHVPTF